MAIDRRKVIKGLTRKGFESREKTRHTFLVYRSLQGQKTAIRTFVSRGSKHSSIGVGLVSTMANQCRLSSRQFRELVKCDLSREEFDAIVCREEP